MKHILTTILLLIAFTSYSQNRGTIKVKGDGSVFDSTQVNSKLAEKLDISDTSDMLTPYLRKNDSTIANRVTANTNAIATKQNIISNIGDTVKYLKKVDSTGDNGFVSNKKLRTIIGAENVTTLISEPIGISQSGIGLAYIHPTSTFSGEAWNIGAMQNFNQITIKIKARADISLIKFVIKTNDKDGTIIAAKDVSITILNTIESLVTVRFDTVITNVSATPLYLMWAANGFTSFWGVTNAFSPYPYPTYKESAYITSGSVNFSGFSYVTSPSSASAFGYTKIELVTPTGIAPDVTFSEKVASASTTVQSNKTDISFTKPKAEIVIPSRIFALTGKETNIYFADVVYSNLKHSQLNYDITCTKGSHYEKFWRVTPVAADTGTYSLKIDVIWNKQIIATATTTLYIADTSWGSGLSRSVIGVGNSTLASGQPLAIIISEHGSDGMTVTFKGTQGTGSNKHEGRSGWTISDFATVGRTLYKYTVSGVTVTPGLTAIYSDGTNQFTIREIKITTGSGYFSAERTTGAGTSPSSGTLTKISGTGDATITYSAWVTTPANPFWISGALNFGSYLTNNSITMTSGDWVFISLGINDVFSYTDSTTLATQINNMTTNLRTLMTNMHSAVSGLRIAICVEIPPTISQDGFGANYGSGQTLYQYTQNIKAWQKRVIEEFDNDTERTAGNYLIPWNAILDRENNMQKSTWDANARNSTQIETYTNGVHPAQSGYDQMGDELWAFLKYMR